MSGIRDVRRLAHELGLNVIENFATAELYRNVLARPADAVADFQLLLGVHDGMLLTTRCGCLAPARRSPKGEGSTRHVYTTGQGLWTITSNCAAVDGANQA